MGRNPQTGNESASTNYLRVVPNSHRFTLYGLKIELDSLYDNASNEDFIREKISYILTGIANSVEAGEEILKKP